MPDFVYDIPTVDLAIWFTLIALAMVIFGLFVIKPIFRLLLGTGTDFNASINYMTSGFSLFYGLLLGLLTVAAYQNGDRVKESVMIEAASLGVIYSQLNAYPEPFRSDVKELLRDYVLYTIYKEWPAHRQGRILNGGYNRAGAIFRTLSEFEPDGDSNRIIHEQVIAGFQDFVSARQLRLSGVITAIPNILWYAVFVGAGISIFLVVLLKIPILQHIVLGSISAFFLGVILLVITTLDRPLRGQAGLPPVPLQLLWERAMIWDEPLGERNFDGGV